ncbi:hypothetical protein KUTeg_007720 [Tegillarca granosa]|uniref:RING-type domain-containing protein n=1 Tax=Tegillarca granosa TaxID=220873 RepID=A0ABQ9FIQ3_TEGGR|nr:hypothetical protein KUTeg_007720 [Tegillarca granosa]
MLFVCPDCYVSLANENNFLLSTAVYELEPPTENTNDNISISTEVQNSGNTSTSNVTPTKLLMDTIAAESLIKCGYEREDQTCCKICVEKEVSIVFLPCGHLCSCVECAPALKQCPICRATIKGTVKAYLS